MDSVRGWRIHKPGTHTRELKEALPDEVRQLIEQLRATVVDHEKRLVDHERFREGLIGAAIEKLKGAA